MTLTGSEDKDLKAASSVVFIWKESPTFISAPSFPSKASVFEDVSGQCLPSGKASLMLCGSSPRLLETNVNLNV